jgi:hypothetical protein
MLASFAPLMNGAADKLAQRCLYGLQAHDDSGKAVALKNGSATQPFDLTEALAAFTLEVIGRTAVG